MGINSIIILSVCLTVIDIMDVLVHVFFLVDVKVNRKLFNLVDFMLQSDTYIQLVCTYLGRASLCKTIPPKEE